MNSSVLIHHIWATYLQPWGCRAICIYAIYIHAMYMPYPIVMGYQRKGMIKSDD